MTTRSDNEHQKTATTNF